jgi:hypothetical protein
MAKSKNTLVFITLGLIFILAATTLIKSEYHLNLNTEETPEYQRHIIEKWLHNQDNIDTLSFDTTIKGSLSGSILESLQITDIKIMNLTGVVDNINKKIHVKGDISNVIKLKPEAYLMQQESFISISGTGWIKSERSFGLWSPNPKTGFSNSTVISVEGQKNINSQDCYAIKINAGSEDAAALLIKEFGVKNYGNESEAFKNLRNLTSTEYISKETFLPVRSETELTFQDEDETAGFKIKVYTNYRDINNITEIKLPEETEYYIEERYMIGLDDMLANLPLI